MSIKLEYNQKFKNENIQQDWYSINVKQYRLTIPGEKPIDTTNRFVGITYPINYNKNKEYDYIINLDFNINGQSSDWYQYKKDKPVGAMYGGLGGYIPLDSNTKPWYDNCQMTGFNYLMSLMKNLVNKNYIIIQLSMTETDNYLFSECHDGSKYKYCWSPNNPDLNYLQNLFDLIKNDKFPIKLNKTQVSFIGYSVGAQAVSRYINEFPFLKTINGIKFPKIISSVLIAGGSYFCYDEYLYNTLPYSQCLDSQKRGCCPNNITEQNYKNGKLKWSDHPPVLLVQQSNDFFADPFASVYYFNVMTENNAPVLRLSDESNTHGINSYDQSNKIFNFIDNIFNPPSTNPPSANVSSNYKLNILLLIFLIILLIINIYMIFKNKNYLNYFILLILIIIITFIIINLFDKCDKFKITEDILISKKKNNKSSAINKKNIVDKINQNGILITMNSTNLYCPEFKETLQTCTKAKPPDYDDYCTNYKSNCPFGETKDNCKCINENQCTLFDITNVEELLNYNLTDAGTSCFALDTTYLNKNLPPVLFGPYLTDGTVSNNGIGESFPIGFLLDFDNLKKNGYLACGYTFDAGSIGRTPPDGVIFGLYNQKTADKCLDEALKITDDDLIKGKLYVGDKGKVNKKNCPASVMAGCLNFDSTYTPADKVPDLNNLSTNVIQNCKDIKNEKCLTPNAFSDKTINPYFEFNDKGFGNFKNYAKKIQNILGKQSRSLWNEDNILNFYNNHSDNTAYPDYWAYQIGSDVYYNNYQIGWGSDGYKETEVDLFIPQKQGTDIKIRCQPTEKFKKVWKESILGIFTNNICYQDVKYNNAAQYFPEAGGHCCTTDFNKGLVKRLVDKFNNENDKKINGYVIETIKPGVRIVNETNLYDYNKIITPITDY